MKKIIGIFLAVCFVLSVTAAAASAGYDNNYKKDKKDNYKKYDKKDGKDKKYKKNWVKGHSEKKKVKYYQKKWVGFRYIQVVYYKIIMIWIPGFWSWCWC